MLDLLVPTGWTDYELLDSGGEAKLERFGPYRFVRPESAAIWRRSLPEKQWQAADAVFAPSAEGAAAGDAGRWQFRRKLEERWVMRYRNLQFWVQPTPFRHLGVFPEQSSHWDWMTALIRGAERPVRVLNLFAYTGVATLAAAEAGAQVTHVDASKKTMAWARDNQALSGLEDRPIRWILDDALKFVQREARRGGQYDGFIIDPPKFGRGPKGEVWQLETSLPALLAACRSVMTEQPLFVVLTAYATRISSLSLRYLLEDAVSKHGGTVSGGELGIREASAGRVMPTAIYARWAPR
jgi:23S rRNA (cytosine1962-C5)-methyltransferase